MIDEKQKAALVEALQRFGSEAIGPEIFEVVEVPDNLDADDPEAVTKAAKKIAAAKPNLFRRTDWEKLESEDADAFADRERAFKASLSKSRPFVSPYKELDASRLEPEELRALEKAMVGEANSWSLGLLRRAAARQKAEDKIVDGGAA